MELAEGPLLPRGKQPIPPAERDIPSQSHSTGRKKKEDDILFGAQRKNVAKKRVASTTKTADPKKQAKVEEKTKTISSLMTLGRVAVGMKFLACVTRVTKDKVVLLLCNHLTCVVPASEVSDEHYHAIEQGKNFPSLLTDCVKLNSFVPVVVQEIEKYLKVSMRMSKVNFRQPVSGHLFGSVKSLEDHGALINFGVNKLSGFLPFSKTTTPVAIGQVLDLQFEGETGVVNCKVNSYDASGNGAPLSSFAHFTPGLLIKHCVKREDLFDGGMSFAVPCGTVEVAAVSDWFHGRDFNPEDANQTCTVLWVDPVNKIMGISFLPHLVQRRRSSNQQQPYKVGDVIKHATVIHYQSRLGVLLEKDGFPPLFAPLHRLLDMGDVKMLPTSAQIKEKYPDKAVVNARIVEVNPLEGSVVVTLQPSALLLLDENQVELAVGNMVTGKITRIDARLGLFVQLAHVQQQHALVSLLHVADVIPVDLTKRFKVGQEIKAMVLSVEEEEEEEVEAHSSPRRVFLTMKKSILTSTLPPVTACTEDLVGRIAIGVIVKIDPLFGMIVSFFNQCKGLVPTHDLGKDGQRVMEQDYHLGQSLKVRIVQVKPLLEKIRLSVKLTPAPSAEVKETKLEDPTLLAQGIVVSKTADECVVEFMHDKVLRRGTLHKFHMSDFPLLAEHVFAQVVVGQKMKNILLLDTKRNALSCKPELIAEARRDNLPSRLNLINLDSVYSAFVTGVEPYGVFVQFAGGLVGFAPVANVDPHAKFDRFATVRVLVVSVDMDKERMVCSLKSSVVGSSAKYVQGWKNAMRSLCSSGELRAQLDALAKSNELVKVTVTHRVDGLGVGLSVSSNNSLVGFCALEHCPSVGSLPKLSSEFSARVLDVNYTTGVIDFSARKSLRNAQWLQDDEEEMDQIAMEAEVELWKPEYAVVSFRVPRGEDGRMLALVSLSSFNKPGGSVVPLKVGTKLSCMRTRGNGSVVELNEEKQLQQLVKRTRSRSGSLTEFLGPIVHCKLNSVVSVRIRDLKGCWIRIHVRTDDPTSFRQAMIHTSDVLDPVEGPPMLQLNAGGALGALAGLSIGDICHAKCVEISHRTAFFSLRKSELLRQGNESEVFSWTNVLPQVGQRVSGWVDEVCSEGILVGLSRHMRGFCSATMVCDDVSVLEQVFNSQQETELFPVGRPVWVEILHVEPERKRLDVKMIWAQ